MGLVIRKLCRCGQLCCARRWPQMPLYSVTISATGALRPYIIEGMFIASANGNGHCGGQQYSAGLALVRRLPSGLVHTGMCGEWMTEEIALKDFGAEQKTSYCIDLDTRDRQVMEIRAQCFGAYSSLGLIGAIALQWFVTAPALKWSGKSSAIQMRYHLLRRPQIPDHHGVIPTWHCEVDPRPHKAELIGTPHEDVETWSASVCHQKVFDLLEGFNVNLWHVFAHESSRSGVPVAYRSGGWAITGGLNVGMRAMVLARFLGFKKMTLFGMDYSFKNDGTQHAGWHPKEIPCVHAVEVAGEFFYTNPAMRYSPKNSFERCSNSAILT